MRNTYLALAAISMGTACGSSSDKSTDVQPLYLAFTFHLEGPNLVANQTAFDRYVGNIRATSELFHRHGAIPTWEGAEIVEKSTDYGLNILKELEDAGDSIGLHANGVGYSPNDPSYTTEDMETELLRQRANIDALGVDVRHVSNICSAADWVKATQTANFDAVTGVVDYCLKSLSDPGAEIEACAAPNECHTAYPHDTVSRTSSWFAESGSDWTTHVESGTLILPTMGTVPCAAEEASGAISPTMCTYGDDDVAAVLNELEIAVEARQPGQVHSVVLVASFGQTPNTQVMESLLSQIKTSYVDTGKARWTKIAELIEARKN